MTNAPPGGPIAAIRGEIDKIDDQILGLLNRRAALAIKIGGLKAEIKAGSQTGATSKREPAREKAIIERLERANGGPFPGEAVAPIFGEIFKACSSVQDGGRQNGTTGATIEHQPTTNQLDARVPHER